MSEKTIIMLGRVVQGSKSEVETTMSCSMEYLEIMG
jgi:hypothetical protein